MLYSEATWMWWQLQLSFSHLDVVSSKYATNVEIRTGISNEPVTSSNVGLYRRTCVGRPVLSDAGLDSCRKQSCAKLSDLFH